jgi:hypothetical protein
MSICRRPHSAGIYSRCHDRPQKRNRRTASDLRHVIADGAPDLLEKLLQIIGRWRRQNAGGYFAHQLPFQLRQRHSRRGVHACFLSECTTDVRPAVHISAPSLCAAMLSLAGPVVRPGGVTCLGSSIVQALAMWQPRSQERMCRAKQARSKSWLHECGHLKGRIWNVKLNMDSVSRIGSFVCVGLR